MKKKVFKLSILFLLSFLLLLSLSACNVSVSEGEGKQNDDEKIQRIIETSALQYPAKNENYYYNVYEDYVAITKYCGTATEVAVPEKIEELPVYVIANRAFEETEVIKVKIPEGIVEIWKECFEGCESLETIELPSTLSWVGERAFADCVALTEIIFPAKVSVISSYVCKGCTSLKEVRILANSNDSAINSYAFSGCTELENVYVTEKITVIAYYSFSDIPSSVIFHAPKGSAAAKFCAENFFAFDVVENIEGDKSEI